MNPHLFRTRPALAIAAFAIGLSSATLALAHGNDEHMSHGADAAAATATPFGKAGDPKRVTRTIHIGMSDAMRYTPAELRVKRGETVRLVASNKGQVLHEIVLGTDAELGQHAEQMRQSPQMAHGAAYMAHVEPGRAGEIVWQFSQPGVFQFACLLPGHFEAGMHGKVIVK